MSRFTANRGSSISTVIVRYLVPVMSVGLGFSVNLGLQHLAVRDPVILIYLTAIAVSFWYSQTGPGVVAFLLSSGCLFYNFLTSEHTLLRLALYDFPTLFLYALFAWCIRRFTESRRQLEGALKHNAEELEEAVKTRTTQLTRVNSEYKTILEAAPFGIVLMGPDRIVQRSNPAYESMLGYGPGELFGKRAPLPEEQQEAWRHLEAALRRGDVISDHETPRVRRDGSEFSATIWMTPLQDGRGAFTGLVGFILDNTERNAREAERQMLTTLIQHSPDLVAVTDETGRLTFINSAGRKLLGVDATERAVDINLWEHFRQNHHVSSGALATLSRNEDDRFEVGVISRHPDTGEEIHLCCTSFPIPPTELGGFVLQALVAQDVSKRTVAETKLRVSLDENQRLLEEIRLLQERLQRENISLHEHNLALQSEIAEIQRSKFEKILGTSPAIQRTLFRVNQVAPTDSMVLITGETGTGKELIASAIHHNSLRARKPFHAFNCASLPASLIASALFGHEKGAFTGADRQRIGRFELAAGGTLFLDEIGDMPLETQAMLLRVLEERMVEHVGGNRLIPVDVRVIAATNCDLHAAMRDKLFRPDLFYRLSAFQIEVPPLRERKEDIPILVSHFAQTFAAEHGKVIHSIDQGTMDLLLGSDWPGNIRELQNVIRASVITSTSDVLTVDPELLLQMREETDGPIEPWDIEMDRHKRKMIERALRLCGGRVSGDAGAARLLGVKPSTLFGRMKALGIKSNEAYEG